MFFNRDRLIAVLLCLLILPALAFAEGKQEPGTQAQRMEVWIATTFVDAQNNWLKAKVEEWAAKAGVQANVALLPKEVYTDKFIASLDAKTWPDVVLQGTGGHIMVAELGLAVSLDEVVDRIGKGDFYESILDISTATDPDTKEEHVFGIPLGFELRTAEIRGDLLDQAGVSIPDSPDYQWLFESARAMNNPPETYGLGFVLGRCWDGHDNVVTLIYSYGGGLMSDKGPNGGDIFNSEPTWRAFDDLKELYFDGIIPPDSVGWTDFDNNVAFMEGRVATSINGLSIYYRMVQENNPIAKVTREVPLTGAKVCDTGGKSLFVMESTPEKEQLGKDLVYHILSDKESYRVNMIEEAQLYSLPIFKSQGAIITQQWKSGKYPMFAVDPMEAAMVAFSSPMVTYPFGEANSVADKLFKSLTMPESWVVLFTRDTDSKQVAKEIAQKINNMIADTYGK
ncbi:MAG: extracellular solute-binding protein [Spirochaetales bacterium]|nr:extracellular solute-binding protein [Spirochaetales bacterium]